MVKAPTKEMFDWWSDEDNRKKLKKQLVWDMAAQGATQKDIADALGCTQHNVSLTYRKEFEAGRRSLKMSVRQWQILKARQGDTQMLLHCGRVYCEDQKDLKENHYEPGTLFQSIDRLMECGNLAINNETSSSTLMQDTTSL